ncbi:phospholipid binding protein [Lichtheimia corymbifera JMRC:FSU:9682]|uniref:Phospholipid binding protein n=1 Tax=Lichtheimia corymbifera JMRC:FSU:9682 TaxID=1263082 RepID=A0A068RH78_9FUNG|nr:phospholipid binding protein [Lichtheimia corymbifera JMRC:FSU:9682]
MAQLETVYVTHNFDAENDDEIALKAGEPVIVIEKDEEFKDGWWKGRNARGEIGLFPMNYTSTVAPTSLEKTIGSIEDVLSSMQLSNPTDESLGFISSDVTSASFDKSRRSSASGASSSNNRSPITRTNMYRNLDSSLSSSLLKDTAPEDWSTDQVALWIDMMGFKDVAETFKLQEITGDVLLELTPESLKELDIGTFGKRHKIHNAIQALRQETLRDDSSLSQQLHRRRQSLRESSATPSITGSGSPKYHAADQHVSAFNRTPSVSAPILSQQQQRSPPPAPPRVASPEPLSPSDVPVQYTIKSSVGNAMSIPTSLDTNDTRNGDLTHGTTRSNGRSSFLRGSFLGSAAQKPGSIFSLVNRNSVDIRRNTVLGKSGSNNEQGKPDMEGWLHKQGDKYRTWNKRWFVLQGMNLYYFKSPKDLRVKGIINLDGYRVLTDETIHSGKYCFKLQHDRERTFYFYTDSEKVMKNWLRGLIKVTISRNYNTPVLSSNTIPTVSLDAARRLKPRPPSMVMQSKDDFDYMSRSDSRPFSLTNYESGGSLAHQPSLRASRSESMAPSLREQARSPWRDPVSRQPSLSRSASIGSSSGGRFHSQRNNQPPSHTVYAVPEEDEDTIDPICDFTRKNGTLWSTDDDGVDYVKWVNQHLERPIQRIGQLQTGDLLVELLESISGKSVRRPPPSGSASMQTLDTIVAAFRFMGREGIRIDGSFTIKDVYGGNESKIQIMLDSIRDWAAAEDHRITDDAATHLSF